MESRQTSQPNMILFKKKKITVKNILQKFEGYYLSIFTQSKISQIPLYHPRDISDPFYHPRDISDPSLSPQRYLRSPLSPQRYLRSPLSPQKYLNIPLILLIKCLVVILTRAKYMYLRLVV